MNVKDHLDYLRAWFWTSAAYKIVIVLFISFIFFMLFSYPEIDKKKIEKRTQHPIHQSK